MIYSDHVHKQVYDSGFQRGLTGKAGEAPLPVGAILLADWEQGVQDGLAARRKGKRPQIICKHDEIVVVPSSHEAIRCVTCGEVIGHKAPPKKRVK